MRSVSEFIDELGGPAKVAGILNRGYTTVASWKSRGSIPVEYWPRLVDAARESGKDEISGTDYETMVRLHTENAA